MTLPERVLRTVRRFGLIPAGGRVVVALSGGADSVVLLFLLRQLEAAGQFTVAGIAHFNHQLRGRESDEDESFCRAVAVQAGLPIEVGRGDVRRAALDEGRSIEDAARRLRYAFLDAAAGALGADVIAVAHTVDDQAETFLLRLMRGAGPRGLAGILPKAGRVVRPLIDVRRAELRVLAAKHSLEFREDASNADVAIPRNRIRHELLPYLERSFSPGIIGVLAREAAIARDDEDRLQNEAIDLAGSIVLTNAGAGGVVRVDAGALTSLHPALEARVARLALAAAAPSHFIGFDQIERFVGFAACAEPGQALSLPGLHITRDADGIVLASAPPRRQSAHVSNSFRFPLSIPGEVTLDREGWAVSATPEPGSASKLSVPIQASAVHLPLAVRFRIPGDRVRPGGMGGRSRKLQDVFVDRKIPRSTRDSVPLVVDDSDRIVWVIGEAVSEDFRVTEPSSGVIFLKARRLGGLG